MVSSTRRRALAAATLFAALACGESPTTPATPDAFAPNERGERVALEVARAIAVAMADPDVRLAVRDAMQASPFAEHKLLLHEFMQTPAGDAVRASAATRGVNVAALTRAITELPHMDFYVPFDEHRLEWTGGNDVLVTATMDVNDPKLVAFHTSGVGALLDVSEGGPAQALFMVHPSERKRRRLASSDAAGLVSIEGPGERLEPWVVEVSRAGSPTFMSLSSSVPKDTVLLEVFRIWFNMDASGDSEPEFRATVYANTNGTFATCCYKSWEHPNAEPRVIHPGGIIGHRIPIPSRGEYMNVALWENDPFNDDGYYGTVVVPQEGAYEWRTSMYGDPNADGVIRFIVGEEPRLTSVTVDPVSATRNVGEFVQLTATAYDQHGYVMDDLTGMTVTWTTSNSSVATVSQTGAQTARATGVGGGTATITATYRRELYQQAASGSSTFTVIVPTSLPVEIAGPSPVRPNQLCSYSAVATGGSGNYSYSWSTGSTESQTEYMTRTGQTSFTLTVTVTDNNTGLQGTATRRITVSTTGTTCSQ